MFYAYAVLMIVILHTICFRLRSEKNTCDVERYQSHAAHLAVCIAADSHQDNSDKIC